MSRRSVESYLVVNCRTCGERVFRNYILVMEVDKVVASLPSYKLKKRKLKSGVRIHDYVTNTGLCNWCFECNESDGDEYIEEILREEGFC